MAVRLCPGAQYKLRDHSSIMSTMERRTAIALGIFLIIYAILSFTVFPKVIALGLETAGITQPKQESTSSASVDGEVKQPATNKIGLGGLVATIPTPTPVPKSLVPIGLVIPKLNIRANVEHVGQTKTLNMDVPKNAADVAWYLYGAKPGEEGNAIINGHYDTPSGRPAVFYSLKTLEKGDEIQVVSEDGVITDFVVTGKDELPYDKFPSEYVFFTKPGTNLNLITCDGVWNTALRNYSSRVVVYTSLKSTVQ